MKKQPGAGVALLILAFCFFNSGAHSQITDTLYKNFVSPPNSARPRVWWHWMNGNITKDGIAKDLEWMNRVGIGGFQNFDAAFLTPQIVKKRLVYMTPEWKDAFRFAAKLADSLQLEMAIASSPGWSESGGPWVAPADGMKKIVWSETFAEGGKSFKGNLPNPPSVSGPFQNLPLTDGGLANPTSYYHDIAVIAYRLPGDDIPMRKLQPKVTSSGGSFNLAQLTDGDVSAASFLPADTLKKYAWIQFEFANPQFVKGITVAGGGVLGYFDMAAGKDVTRSLQVSDDGVNFQLVTYIPAGKVAQQTVTFPAVKGKIFRVIFNNPPVPFSFGPMPGGSAPKAPAGTAIAEIVLHTAARIDRFEEKAAFAAVANLYSHLTPATDDTVSLKDVIDLTGKLNPDGSLNWTPPPGNWNVDRFGYSLTGIVNHPATPEATGLEVDKLDPVAVKNYFENYLGQYNNATNGLMGYKGGVKYMVTDSYESGPANWTKKMPAEFEKRRGYSLLPWLPVLTGHIVGSAEQSEHFLWDFRKTLSELISEYHYDQLTTLLHERGMKRYSESHESGRAYVADGMEVKRTADIPMSAMWAPRFLGPSEFYRSDIRESASVAHIYGQNLVAAESFTAVFDGWSWSPETLKPTADLELSCGLNRFVIHTSVHQPTDDKIPGLSLGPFGQWFNRHETWAEQAKPWMDYLARSSYLLQQGKFVADVIYYYGEDNNITAMFKYRLPDIPEGFDFDFVNSDALLNRLSVKSNELVTPTGMKYKILALDSNSRYMTLKVLRKIRDLVNAGAVVAGAKPIGSPSLADNKQAFDLIADSLWNTDNPVKPGKGRVYSGQTIAQVLTALNIAPDFQYTRPHADTKLLYVHRRLPGKEIYWVNNRSDSIENIEGNFRTAGKSVEIWHAETGEREQASYTFANGRTKVPLELQPHDAVFVVFGESTGVTSRNVPAEKEKELSTVKGKWLITFQKDRGAPAEISVGSLKSWTESADAGVKYFSGTAIYFKKFDASAAWFKKGEQVWIDLGNVKNIAEVMINGKSAGILWHKPFRAEIGAYLRPGKNSLQIKVTNLWVNRLIGDKQPGVVNKITFTSMPFYTASSPLLPSGLMGPVKIISLK